MSDSGIGSQVVHELANVAKKVATDVVSVPGAVVQEAVEAVTSSGSQNTQTTSGEGKQSEKGQAGSDPLQALKQRNLVKQRQGIERVNSEIEAYRRQQAQEREQKKQIEEQKKMEELQVKESKKQSGLANLLRRNANQSGGTAEVDKTKN